MIENDGTFTNVDKLTSQLKLLKTGGVDGIMVDVWWGIVQRNGPNTYDWSAYKQLFQICQRFGLQVQANMAFHQCGTNVGDECFITLPKWVLQVANSEPNIFYTDREGRRDEEYLTLGVDTVPLFPPNSKRTAVDLYSDFMKQFQISFQSMIGSNNVISSIEVGLGPAGELRYPSYQLQNNLWHFPGIGEFQCYDKFMLLNLNQSAYRVGHPEWGHGGPMNAGNYNSQPPSSVEFFSNDGWNNWSTDYGKFFLSWYSQQLINHGDRILSRAQQIFVLNSTNDDKPGIAAKIAGIHWWYNTDSHAAELTAGYYNTVNYNGYKDIAAMLKKYDVQFAFTCLEMVDSAQHGCACSPQRLVQQTRNAAWSTGVAYTGENALPITGMGGYNQVLTQAISNGKTIDSFTYLRMTDDLFSPDSWTQFTSFVSRLHSLSRRKQALVIM